MTRFGSAMIVVVGSLGFTGAFIPSACPASEKASNASATATTINAVASRSTEVTILPVQRTYSPKPRRFYCWNGPWGPGFYFAPRGWHHSPTQYHVPD